MINILLAGVGGQGTVLAAKILAKLAQGKGWHVRSAETIGMAQRGGSVISHVRMGNEGERINSSLISKESANVIIAFEPSEAARALPYLAPEGLLITARSPIAPVSASHSSQEYDTDEILGKIAHAFEAQGSVARLRVVDDQRIAELVGTKKALNIAMVASVIRAGYLPFTLDDLKTEIRSSVKARFIDLNLKVIDLIERS